MLQLKTEYTDIKDVKHQVEHQVVESDDYVTLEEIWETLRYILIIV